jgi:hypothetical protein
MAEESKTPVWGNVPARYSNFFVVSVSPAIVRITFGEGFGSPESAVFHTAVSLTQQDATALAQSILDTIERDKRARAAAQEAPKDGA